MKKKRTIEQELHRELRKGKAKGLGLLETIHMNYLGKKDGKQGIPKENDEGEWISSVMNKEKNEYEEYCGKIWGMISEVLEEKYKKCAVLDNEISLLGKKLDAARAANKNAAPLTNFARKRGEEDLADSQIIARGKREEEKRMSALRAKVERLEDELSSKYMELAELQHYAEELTKLARMICERVMSHINQRLDIYWRAVLKFHAERDGMPMVVRELSITPRGETKYLSQNKGFEDAMKYTLTRFEKEVTEINLRNAEKKEEVA